MRLHQYGHTKSTDSIAAASVNTKRGRTVTVSFKDISRALTEGQADFGCSLDMFRVTKKASSADNLMDSPSHSSSKTNTDFAEITVEQPLNQKDTSESNIAELVNTSEGHDHEDGVPESERFLRYVEFLKNKIANIEKRLKVVHMAHDELVRSYTKKMEQSPNDTKIKAALDKKGLKSASAAAYLQKKYVKYTRLLKECEERGQTPKGLEMLRMNFSAVMTKPIESSINYLRRNLDIVISGSSENVEGQHHLAEESETYFKGHRNSISDDELSSSSAQDPCSRGSVTELVHLSISRLDCDIQQLQEAQSKTEKAVDELLAGYKDLVQIVHEERERTDQLETRLTTLSSLCNELMELHQNETMAIRMDISRFTDGIDRVGYQSSERAAEMEEALDRCSARISKLEQLQQQQQQLLLNVDRYYGDEALPIVARLLNLVIPVVALLLGIIATSIRLVRRCFFQKLGSMSSSILLAFAVIVLLWYLIGWGSSDPGSSTS